MLARAMSSIFNMDSPIVVALDSYDLFTLVSTQCNGLKKCIRCEVNVIRYDFEQKNVAKFVCIPGNKNLADASTKIDCPLHDFLRRTLETGCLPFNLHASEFCSSDRSLIGQSPRHQKRGNMYLLSKGYLPK